MPRSRRSSTFWSDGNIKIVKDVASVREMARKLNIFCESVRMILGMKCVLARLATKKQNFFQTEYHAWSCEFRYHIQGKHYNYRRNIGLWVWHANKSTIIGMQEKTSRNLKTTYFSSESTHDPEYNICMYIYNFFYEFLRFFILTLTAKKLNSKFWCDQIIYPLFWYLK